MTQKLFPDFGSEGLREARVVYETPAGPEHARTGQEMREQVGKLGPKYTEVLTAINWANSTLNDSRVREMLADRETKERIAAQVALLSGTTGGKYLNEIALLFLQKTHEAFTEEKQAIDGAKTKATDLAKKSADIFRSTLLGLRAQADAYAKAGGKDFPGLNSALETLLGEKKDADTLKEKFDALIDLTREVLWATDDEINTGQIWPAKFAKAGITDLSTYNSATDAPGRREALLKILREAGGVQLLIKADRTKVESAKQAVENKLAEVESAGKRQIQDRFPERIRYLDRLGGTDQEALIHMSLQSDAKLDIDFLVRRLEIIKKTKLTPEQIGTLKQNLGYTGTVDLNAEAATKVVARFKNGSFLQNADALKPLIQKLLISGENALEVDRKKAKDADNLSLQDFCRALLSAWNTKNAEDYLKNDLKVENPTGISWTAMAIRARIPRASAEKIFGAKVDIGVGSLIEVAKIPNLFDAGGKVTPDAAKAIVARIAENPDSDSPQIKDEAFLRDVLAFLKFGTKADEIETWKNEQPPKVLKNVGNNQFALVKEGGMLGLVKYLTEMVVPPDAKSVYDEMVREGVDKVEWKKDMKMRFSEFWKLTGTAAGMWWDYIKSIPRNFWDPDGDKELLKILNQQSALSEGKAALDKLLAKSSGAEDLLKNTEDGLRSRKKAQDKALHGDPAVSPSEHEVQARALVLANLEVIMNELGPLGWHTCGRQLKDFTLWTAMLKHARKKASGPATKEEAYKGVKDAKDLLHEAATLPSEQQDAFVEKKLLELQKKLPDQYDSFIRYRDALATMRTTEGRDILSPYKQRGLNKKPDALELLRQVKDPANPALNLAANVGRWTMDPPEKVRASLEIALEDGPAKAAFINAFVLGKDPATGKDPAYTYQGRTEVVSVIDARLAVNAIQQRLLFEMGGNVKAREQIEDENEFTNPVDRWLRTGIESMKDLWKTDMVGKAEVIAIVFAAYWMIKEAWKSKKGKFVLLGLPILLGANAIYKQRTGRDLLGENLRWKNKEDRSSPLEAFRRRGAALDSRYKILLQPSGQAAVRMLMNEKNPVKVQELLDWRNAVKSGRGKKFSLGMPKSLKVMDIEDALGSTGSREKACEVAYLAFEALCVDVARLNGLTAGNTALNAEQGADLIQRRYVANRNGSLKPASMFDVIMSECQMPTKEMLENKSYLEAAADLFGYTYEEAKALVKKYGVQAWVMMKQGVHKAPEVAGAVKEKVFASAESVWDWARLTKTKLWAETKEDFAAGWDLISRTCSAAGLLFVRKGPDACEWMVDTTVTGAGMAKHVAASAYHKLIGNGVTGPALEWIGKQFSDVFGLNMKEKWFKEEYLTELADYGEFKKTLEERVKRFAIVGPGFGAQVDKWMTELCKVDPVTKPDEYKKISARRRLLAQDAVEKSIFCRLAAERIKQIEKSMDDESYKKVQVPLTIDSWPNAIADMGKDDKVFQYLFANYRPDVVLPLIGNELTFVGVMEQFKRLHRGLWGATFSEILLYPGFLQAVTRSDAAEFVPSAVHAFVDEYATEARKLYDEKKITQAQRDEYLTYIDCLVTNVAFESILSEGHGAKDLLFTKNIAKNLYEHLMEYRGIAPKMALNDVFSSAPTGDGKEIETLLTSRFSKSDPLPDLPSEITNVKSNERGSWLLAGTAPVEKGKEEEKGKVPAAAASKGPEVAKEEDLQKISEKKVKNDADREFLVRQLGKTGITSNQINEIRKKFDDAWNESPDFVIASDQKDAKKALEYFLGFEAGKAEVMGNKLIDLLRIDQPKDRKDASKWLVENVANLRTTYQNHKRFQRLLDEAAMAMLVWTAYEIGAVETKDLNTHANHSFWKPTLENLYRLTSGSEDKRFKDGVSKLLEYVHCAETNNGTFDTTSLGTYVAYLKKSRLELADFDEKKNADMKQRFVGGILGGGLGQQDKGYVVSRRPGTVYSAADGLLKEAAKNKWE